MAFRIGLRQVFPTHSRELQICRLSVQSVNFSLRHFDEVSPFKSGGVKNGGYPQPDGTIFFTHDQFPD
jgi:hypothetical protein